MHSINYNPIATLSLRAFALTILLLAAFNCLAAAPENLGIPKSIRVVMDNSYPPYVFKDEDGQLKGILIDQWRLWEKKTGIHVELSAMDWAEAQRRMQAGEFDVIDTIFRNEQREKIYEFSKPYARIDVPIFFRSDIPGIRGVQDLKGFVVAVKEGDSAVGVLRSHGITNLMEFKSYGALIAAARDHKVNVFTVDKPPALYFLYKMGIYDQFRQTGSFYTGEFHRAVLKVNHPLLETVESGFALISNAEYDEIENRWNGTPLLSVAQWRHVKCGITVVMVLLSALIFWLWMLRRVVAQRTEALRNEMQARIENEAHLHESEERYRISIEQTGRIVYDLDVATGKVSRYGAIEQTTGYAPEEYQSIDFESWVSGIHPDDLADVLPLLTAATRESGAHSIEYRYRTKNGDYVSILDKCFSLANPQGRVYRVLGTMSDISERKQMEQLKEQQLNFMRTLIDTIPSPIFYKDAEGRYLGCNSAFEEYIGFSRSSLVGRTVYDIAPKDLADIYHEADLVLFRSQGVQQYETAARYADGTFHDVIFNKATYADFAGKVAGLVGVITDITERKRAEQAHDKTRQQMQLILDAAGEGIYGVDMQGMVIFINPAAARMIGWGQEELLGMYQHAVLHHTRVDGTPYPEEECRVYQALKDGTSHHVIDEVFWKKDGSSFPVEYLSTPILESGTLVGAVVVFKDITEQIQVEAEKSQLEFQLRQSQKMEAIGNLAGGIAHDFNNILSVISGYSEIMLRKMNPDDPLKEKLVQILAASEKATNLTRSLLAYSRKQLMNPQPTDLNSIVKDMDKFLLRVLGEDINLKTCLYSDTLLVNVDTGQIEQVLMNLATNARDAMPRGGALTIETDHQMLDASFCKAHGFIPGPYALMTVTDSGSGMARDTLEKIFEPFYTTKEPGKGTGLGMAMVYGIVKQHNGYINVSSEPGKGSTFTIYLPALAQGIVTKKDIAAPAVLQGGTETILVAEDDSAIRELMEEILCESGYQVILAENGRDAVDKFIANRDNIHLVILDMIMPKMSGKEAYDEISRLKSSVKVLFSSGYTADYIQDRGDFDARVELIMKPVRPMELLKKVRETLDR